MTGPRARRRPRVAALAGVLLLTGAARAWAASEAPLINAHVRVIRAEGSDPVILEISNRTRAELRAAGLDAAIVDCAAGDAGCAEPRLNAGAIREAVVRTARAGEDTVTEVKVAARSLSAPPLVLRLIVGPDSSDRDDAATLAVRAAELVQSALLQAQAAASSTSPAPLSPPPVPSLPEAITYDFEQPRVLPPPADGTGWFVGGGGALLASADGLGRAAGVMLRGGYAGLGWPGLGLSLMVAAPVLASDLQFPEGRVAVSQELAAAQASWHFAFSPSALQPRLRAGVGVYHIGARGIPEQVSFVGTTAQAWLPMASVGAGVAIPASRALLLFAEAEAVLVYPYPQLLVLSQRVGGGLPSLLICLGADWIL
ncbi:MAG TPA: hypothetical protein VMU50_14215 [Polyangia bacterium]|nr:hypothetical protein [Polyangia bacterium]